uniref:Uncharacterized protein n=1 Tax=Podoviridae sp. ct6BA50 TaxID=2825221 RepID=A0A8S5VGC2_9CAUD|nr:MAG TPA: hypothetical protein [Podoviridae sp. ct6BA50]
MACCALSTAKVLRRYGNNYTTNELIAEINRRVNG